MVIERVEVFWIDCVFAGKISEVCIAPVNRLEVLRLGVDLNEENEENENGYRFYFSMFQVAVIVLVQSQIEFGFDLGAVNRE